MSTISDGTRLTRLVFTIWGTIGALLLAGFVVWIGREVRIIWLPLVFAIGIAVILNPVVSLLHRLQVPRLLGATFAYLLSLVVLVGLGSALSVPVVQQVEELADRIPDIYQAIYDQVTLIANRLGLAISMPEDVEHISEWLRNNLGGLADSFGGEGTDGISTFFWRLAGGVAEALAVILLAPVLAFYLLIDLPRLRALLLSLTPLRHKEEVVHLIGAITSTVSRFARGQLLVASIVALLGSLVMWTLSLPFWLIVGVLSGILNLIPFAGPVAGAALAFLTSLLVGKPFTGLIAILLFTAIQQFDNHVITPMVQRTRVKLSAFTIVLSLVVGGSVAGFLGVLTAVPVVGLFRLLAGHLWRTRVLGEDWHQARESIITKIGPPSLWRFWRRRREKPAAESPAEDAPAEAEPS
ncbi:MAG: AI-2E family transporter [Actinomycetia bacterium]|nr:AI-2E family transporter [Actinomycetes bacterium]